MAGQIIKRGDRKYLVRIYQGLNSQTHKRRYHNHMVNGTRKDAEKWLTQALRRRDLGESLEPCALLFDEFLDQWLEMTVKPRVRERSYLDYRFYLKRYIRPAFGKKRLADLKPIDLQTLYAELQQRGLSARTIRFVHMLLGNALKQAVRWQMIRQNPVAMVDPPKVVRHEMKSLTPEQARAFISALEGDPHGVVLAFALTTGARPEEYMALKWSDIDWEARTVTIRRALVWHYKPTRWYFSEPKTPRSRRTIPLSPTLLKQLSEHKRRQAEERLRAGSEWQNNDLVFPKWHGGPLELATLRLWFRAALKRAEVPQHFRLYDLRHSCASLLMAEGLNPKVVSERLGHASVAITLDIYSHVSPGMQAEASERLENLLFGKLAMP